jgi:beta-1,4-mannosyltransferase
LTCMYDSKRFTNNEQLCALVIPRINDYKYLKCLYKEMLNSAKTAKTELYLYSILASSNSSKSKFFYPFEILNLLLKKKVCDGDKVVLHIHWIEFLYRWGDHKYLVPFLVPPTIAFFQIFKKLSKYKVAVTLHNIRPHKVYWPRIEFIFFKIMLQEISDCIFVHSDLHKKLIVKFYGVDSEKVQLIQHGLFKNSKSRNPIQNRQSRNKLGISQTAVVFSFIGNISEYKGVSVLLEAMKELLRKQGNVNIKLILAGEAKKAYLRYLLRNYNDILNNNHVIFINKRLSEAELHAVLNVADFGICPYVNATTTATLFDFICYNLPIITTDDQNVLDMMKDYPLIIAKKGDPLSLESAINLAYITVTVQEEKTKNFKNISAFTNAWRTSADQTLNSYSSLVGV